MNKLDAGCVTANFQQTPRRLKKACKIKILHFLLGSSKWSYWSNRTSRNYGATQCNIIFKKLSSKQIFSLPRSERIMWYWEKREPFSYQISFHFPSRRVNFVMTRGESLFEDVNLLCLRDTITAVHVKIKGQTVAINERRLGKRNTSKSYNVTVAFHIISSLPTYQVSFKVLTWIPMKIIYMSGSKFQTRRKQTQHD